MLVKDFMIKDVFVAKPQDTLKDLLQIFIENKIGGVPIVDEENHLLSMVTDGDILRYIAPKESSLINYFTYVAFFPGENLDETVKSKLKHSVSNLIKNNKIIKLAPDDDLEKLISVISKHHFKKIPVVDDYNRIVGIVSRGDTLRMVYQGIVDTVDVVEA